MEAASLGGTNVSFALRKKKSGCARGNAVEAANNS